MFVFYIKTISIPYSNQSIHFWNMIYIWQNPSEVLLQSLYNHNYTRSEENKLTFPDDRIHHEQYNNTIEKYNIYNTFWISYIYYRVIMYYKNDDSTYDDKNIHEEEEDDHKNTHEVEEEDDHKNTHEVEEDDHKNTHEVEEDDDKNTHEEEEADYNVFDSKMWSVSDLASVLRECDILTRSAGREMDKSSLVTRMKQVYFNKECSNVYKPSPLGHNWRGFWSPYTTDMIMTVAIVIGTIAGVHYLYTYCEHYHYVWNCSNWRKMYSMECYVIKKARSYLEEMNYNIVYTTLCGLGIALTGMLSRAKAYATRNAGGEK